MEVTPSSKLFLFWLHLCCKHAKVELLAHKPRNLSLTQNCAFLLQPEPDQTGQMSPLITQKFTAFLYLPGNNNNFAVFSSLNQLSPSPPPPKTLTPFPFYMLCHQTIPAFWSRGSQMKTESCPKVKCYSSANEREFKDSKNCCATKCVRAIQAGKLQSFLCPRVCILAL